MRRKVYILYKRGIGMKFKLDKKKVEKITNEKVKKYYMSIYKETRPDTLMICGEIFVIDDNTAIHYHEVLDSVPSVKGKKNYETQLWIVSWSRKEPVIEIVEYPLKSNLSMIKYETTFSVLDYDKAVEVFEDLKNEKKIKDLKKLQKLQDKKTA
jgi:hypothetical protein